MAVNYTDMMQYEAQCDGHLKCFDSKVFMLFYTIQVNRNNDAEFANQTRVEEKRTNRFQHERKEQNIYKSNYNLHNSD